MLMRLTTKKNMAKARTPTPTMPPPIPPTKAPVLTPPEVEDSDVEVELGWLLEGETSARSVAPVADFVGVVMGVVDFDCMTVELR